MELNAVEFLIWIFDGANGTFCGMSYYFKSLGSAFDAVAVAHQNLRYGAYSLKNFRRGIEIGFRNAELARFATDDVPAKRMAQQLHSVTYSENGNAQR